MSAELEFTSKIRYAEEWLNKAKKDFSDGSTTTAASHIILAIAEMETLKRVLFSNEPAIKEMQPVMHSRRIDLRPFIAAALFLIAAGIFAFASHKEYPNTYTQPVMGDSHFEAFIGNLNNKESSSNPILGNLTIPNIADTGSSVTVPDVASNVIKKTTGNHSKQIRKNGSALNYSGSEKTEPASATTSPVIADFTPPVWNAAVIKSELDPKVISLETIIAARESLNEK